MAAARLRPEQQDRRGGGQYDEGAEGLLEGPGPVPETAAGLAGECGAEGGPRGADCDAREALLECAARVNVPARPEREAGAGAAAQRGAIEGMRGARGTKYQL